MNKTNYELLQEVQELQAQLRDSLDHNAALLAQRDRLRVENMELRENQQTDWQFFGNKDLESRIIAICSKEGGESVGRIVNKLRGPGKKEVHSAIRRLEMEGSLTGTEVRPDRGRPCMYYHASRCGANHEPA